MSTPFFKQVLQNMDNMIAQVNSPHKFYMNSAHDTTVLLMLNALNLTSSKC